MSLAHDYLRICIKKNTFHSPVFVLKNELYHEEIVQVSGVLDKSRVFLQAHHAERLFSEETKKEKLMHQRKAELKVRVVRKKEKVRIG